MTLIDAVSNILLRKVTEEEAKKFALKEYGVLCAYIRYDVSSKNIRKPIINEVKEKYENSKIMSIQVDEEYQTWLENSLNSNMRNIDHVDILYGT